MKILHINTHDKSGGAGKAAFRIHTAMLKNNIDSRMLVLRKSDIDNPVITDLGKLKKIIIAPLYDRYSKCRLLKSYSPVSVFSSGLNGFNVSKHPWVQQADIIYLHWINGCMLSIKNIRQILNLGKPVYWYMHDMWPLTGGCHHSFDCSRYMNHCGACPCLSSKKEKDLSYKIFHQKIKQLSNLSNLHAVTPSQWLGNCCKKSILFRNKEVTVIPNILDTDIYKPTDKIKVREILNLPQNKKLILFGADGGTGNPYKGWSYLKNALKEIEIEDCELVVFGSSYDPIIEREVPFPVHFMGRLQDEFSLVLLYNAADVFVSPSLADNFPNTIVEAMACSTLVTSFNVGGIPDLIQHKQTGYLAAYKNTEDLAEGINWCLTYQEKDKIEKAARKHIEKYCSYQQGINVHTKMWAL